MADNTDTARALYDSFAKGDVPGVLGVMDPKIDWREPVSLPFRTYTDTKLWLDALET